MSTMKQKLFLLLVAISLGCSSSQVVTEAKVRQQLEQLRLSPRGSITDSNGRYTLDLTRSDLSDLSVLKGIPIHRLNLYQVPVFDLGPLRGMPLKWLCINRTLVNDLNPLEGMHLEYFYFHPDFIVSGIEVLRKMDSLKSINGQPVDAFWKEYDSRDYSVVAAESKRQVESKKKLKDQTPGELNESLWKYIRWH